MDDYFKPEVYFNYKTYNDIDIVFNTRYPLEDTLRIVKRKLLLIFCIVYRPHICNMSRTRAYRLVKSQVFRAIFMAYDDYLCVGCGGTKLYYDGWECVFYIKKSDNVDKEAMISTCINPNMKG